MAGSSLLALIDDIASLLDDVAAMSKLAAKKTTGVLGDDLALNAQQVTGISPERELPVVWAVCLGSLRNKAILVPAALLISSLLPWLIQPLLMLGGAYLCFEGVEKLAERWLHPQHEPTEQPTTPPVQDITAFEQDKIQGAIRTDFILSAEIIVITLGSVAHASLMQQILVLVLIAIAMTIGVYGLVAAIVKMDDLGLYLTRYPSDKPGHDLAQVLGDGLLQAAPLLMKLLAVVGTLAMFLVGGGILAHGLPGWHDLNHHLLHTLPPTLQALANLSLELLLGIAIGALVLAGVSVVQRIRGR